MMFSNETLLKKWNNLNYHNNGFIRIDAEHPLEWHIGYESINQKTLLLISNFEPTTIPSSKSILVAVGKRADNKWALSFRLIRNEQEDVFIRLSCDLIESSRNQTNNFQGLEFVLHRYNQWAKLMEVQPTGLLSESQKKGLIGEIIFLQQIISKGIPLISAVRGWIGPEGADQDFVYSDGWHEVKALGMGAKTVSISSLEQLDAELPGELVLYFIDKSTPHDDNGFTLNKKVDETRQCLQNSYLAGNLFNEKLLQYGYIELPEYDSSWYRLRRCEKYVLDHHFPRLVKENVPSQVTTVNYQLSIESIERWKVE